MKSTEILGLPQTQGLILPPSEYWDKRLRDKFALSPINQKLTKLHYTRENRAWGSFISELMFNESSIGSICILGFGLGRDSDWIPSKLGIRGDHVIVDYSKVACGNASTFIKRRGISRHVKVVNEEIMKAWKNLEIDDSTIQAYFLSQFMEHQGQNTHDFIYHLGNFLKTKGKVVYIITPTKEDNENVLWNHAVPLWEHEWRSVLDAGLGEPADVQVLGKHKYFDRTYTFFKLTKLDV